MASLCSSCRKTGRVWCPHNAALQIRSKLSGSLKQEMFGPSPPNIFVGHNFYPTVYWGPLVSADEEHGTEEDPSKMYGMSLQQIVEARAGMVRGMKRDRVQARGRMLQESQEAVMSIKPVDVEARFSKPPSFSLEFDAVAHPIGASAPIERFRLAGNPEIPKKVDELADEGMKAQAALQELLLSGFDVHYLSKLLASGILGGKEARKLVPTKWAITATDDMAGKRLMESVRDYRELSEIRLYSNKYLENHFEVLLLPGSWEYEQFETALTPEIESLQKKRLENFQTGRKDERYALRYVPAAWEDWKADGRINISQEHEPFSGRRDYADRQGGGYYAARFAVAEGLYNMNRQARAIVFREIGTGYMVPVGVWEVRENVRHAFLNPPEKFDDLGQALSYLSDKLAVPMREYARRSLVLSQRKLTEF